MDIERMSEVARSGDVECLHKLVKADPRILHYAALDGGETPLHIACKAGKLDFVREIIKLGKKFTEELNQEGFSPLHIASAKGDVEIVKELLIVDRKLCMIKGREGRIALHQAAGNGRVDAIKELLSADAAGGSIACVTARGETALHLALRNHHHEAFRVLVEHLKQFKEKDDKVPKEVLNKQDILGNTILHLAVSRKECYQEVDFLLNGDINVPKGLVDVNSANKRDLTPLGVLLTFQSEAGDREIQDILRQAGANVSKPNSSVQNFLVFLAIIGFGLWGYLEKNKSAMSYILDILKGFSKRNSSAPKVE